MPAQIASKVAGYGGSGAAALSGVAPEQWQQVGLVLGLTPPQWQAIGVIGGIVFAALGWGFNAWLGWRRDQREERARGGQR